MREQREVACPRTACNAFQREENRRTLRLEELNFTKNALIDCIYRWLKLCPQCVPANLSGNPPCRRALRHRLSGDTGSDPVLSPGRFRQAEEDFPRHVMATRPDRVEAGRRRAPVNRRSGGGLLKSDFGARKGPLLNTQMGHRSIVPGEGALPKRAAFAMRFVDVVSCHEPQRARNLGYPARKNGDKALHAHTSRPAPRMAPRSRTGSCFQNRDCRLVRPAPAAAPI